MSCALIVATLGIINGCGLNPKISDQSQIDEVPAKKAKVGDVLVINDDTQVVLTAPFRPGQPNGLYDGAVKTGTTSAGSEHHEVNAICSMPGLDGWPEYDNIYGKAIRDPSDAGQEGGNTEWQLLLTFNGEKISKGIKEPPKWAERLVQNLCRKGDFNDQNIEAKAS